MATDNRKKRSVIDVEKGKIAKNLADELKKQELHLKDTELTERAISSLRSAGTSEGHDQRRKKADSADSAIKAEAAKQEQAERKISDEGKRAEVELKGTSDLAAHDSATAKKAMEQVKFDGAKRELNASSAASADDSQFLGKTAKEQEGNRVTADTATQAFAQNIKRRNIKLK